MPNQRNWNSAVTDKHQEKKTFIQKDDLNNEIINFKRGTMVSTRQRKPTRAEF